MGELLQTKERNDKGRPTKLIVPPAGQLPDMVVSDTTKSSVRTEMIDEPIREQVKKRLLQRTYFPDPADSDTCWLWIGGTNGAGYGQVRIIGKAILVHRLSWMIYKGKIPKRMLVCHKCDTPNCWNPHHLFLGMHKDNADDAIAKGRKIKIGRIYWAKHMFTEDC
jgi:hypothetical protein